MTGRLFEFERSINTAAAASDAKLAEFLDFKEIFPEDRTEESQSEITEAPHPPALLPLLHPPRMASTLGR